MALTFETHMLRLSDDVLLHIMSYLKSHDILPLAKVCTRLAKICNDRTLWKIADLRPAPLTHAELEEAVRCFHQGTKVFATTGMAIKKPMCIETNQIPPFEDCLSPVLLEQVNEICKIETLILEEHFINASTLTYKCLPSSVKHLSMENSHLLNAPVRESYFFNMASHTTQLESLNLSGCSWFEDHSMMAISKCPKLKVLRLRTCPKVGTCAAYIFLSARFGFEAIEVLDLRETAVSDSEVRAFKSKPNLKRLYIDGRLHRKNDADEVDRVTDKGLNTPAEPAPYLEVLTLTNTQITDVTLNNLASNVPNLQLIDIRGTCVTEPGVAKLRSNYPTLKLVCDFTDWTTDLSSISDDLWIDKDFFHQEEVKQPPILVPRQAPAAVDDGAGPLQNEQIEILPVQDGFVRLRRIVVYHQAAAAAAAAAAEPAPPQPELPNEAPPQLPPVPRDDEREEHQQHPPPNPSP